MTGNEFTSDLRLLQTDRTEFAREIGVAERTVRRWEETGVDGPAEAFLRLAFKLRAIGLPWRKWEIPIALSDGGQIVQLSDKQAVLRHDEMQPWIVP